MKTMLMTAFFLFACLSGIYSQENERRYELRVWHDGDKTSMCVFDIHMGNVYLFAPKAAADIKGANEEGSPILFWAAIPGPASKNLEYVLGLDIAPKYEDERDKKKK